MKSYIVEFRYFASYDCFTPLMYIPKQRTIIRAESTLDARRRFFETDMVINTLKGEYAGHFTIEDIYQNP